MSAQHSPAADNEIDEVGRNEITDALIRYTLAVDFGRWDDLDTVYTPDAHIDYTQSGGIAAPVSEIKGWLAENLPAFSTKRMHTLGQIAISQPDSVDQANVTAYFHNPMLINDGNGGERLVEVGGFYHHTFVKTDAGWRSKQLFEEVVWTRGF